MLWRSVEHVEGGGGPNEAALSEEKSIDDNHTGTTTWSTTWTSTEAIAGKRLERVEHALVTIAFDFNFKFKPLECDDNYDFPKSRKP